MLSTNSKPISYLKNSQDNLFLLKEYFQNIDQGAKNWLRLFANEKDYFDGFVTEIYCTVFYVLTKDKELMVNIQLVLR